LKELNSQEAEEFVHTNLNSAESNVVMELCALLHNLPLALQQAVAYIKHQQRIGSLLGANFGPSHYITQLKSTTMEKELLKYKIYEGEQAVFMTWQISINQILLNEKGGKDSYTLLKYLAYFDPDGVSCDTLEYFEVLSLKDNTPLTLLSNFSLVRIEDKVVSMHRLVQKVVRLNSPTYALSSVSLHLRRLGSKANCEKEEFLGEDYLRQLTVLWGHIKSDKKKSSLYSFIPSKIITTLLSQGRDEEISRFAKETVDEFEGFWDPDGPIFKSIKDAIPFTSNSKAREAAAEVTAVDILRSNWGTFSGFGIEGNDSSNWESQRGHSIKTVHQVLKADGIEGTPQG